MSGSIVIRQHDKPGQTSHVFGTVTVDGRSSLPELTSSRPICNEQTTKFEQDFFWLELRAISIPARELN